MVSSWSNFHKVDAARIVDAQAVSGVGGGGDVARRTARCLQRGKAYLSAFALDRLPRDLVDGHAILAHDERVGVPKVLGMEAGPAIIDGRHGVADGEVDFLADDGYAIQVGHAGIAIAGMQILRAREHAA